MLWTYRRPVLIFVTVLTVVAASICASIVRRLSAPARSLAGVFYVSSGLYLERYDLARRTRQRVLKLEEPPVHRVLYDVDASSRSIAFIERGTSGRLEADTLVVQRLGSGSTLARRRLPFTVVSPLAFSPDADEVAVVAEGSAGSRLTLYVVSVGRGTLSLLASDVGYCTPTWLDGGSTVTYVDDKGNGVTMVRRTRRRGRLGSGCPLAAPGGGRIVLSSGALLDLRLRNHSQLLLPVDAQVVGWSADSRWVLVARPAFFERLSLWAMALKDSSLVPLPFDTTLQRPTLWRSR